MEHARGPNGGKTLRPAVAPRVLVIDDSESSRSLMSALLTDAGMTVSCLESSLGATSAIIRHSPHVLVVDLHMPMVSGGKLIDLVRRNPVLDDVRVILISGESDEELRRVGKAVGADAVIAKRELKRLLPTAVRHLMPAQERVARAPQETTRTAFVVFGDPAIAESFRARLQKGGFEVLVRSSAWGVTRYLAEHPPTVLFVADDLPELRAAEIIAPLREAIEAGQTSVVLCGPRDDADLIATAARLGIRSTIRYDAQVSVFEQKVRDLLAGRKDSSVSRKRPS